MGGGFGGGFGNASQDCLIQVNGGTITINAGGDGIDSNGNVEVTGGTMLVNGSQGGGDSALDYEYTATISGGTVLMAGSTGMAETFSAESTQPFALVTASGNAGSTLELQDANGKTLATYTVPKAFQCVVVSSPDLAEGATGKLVVDGTATEFTVSTTPTGGMGGMGGGRGGNRDASASNDANANDFNSNSSDTNSGSTTSQERGTKSRKSGPEGEVSA
jgi:hypothetical protein